MIYVPPPFLTPEGQPQAPADPFAPTGSAYLGTLARWLDDALRERVTDAMRGRVMVRFEVLYARRSASRRTLEPIADLARETTWLLRALEDEREPLGLEFQVWQSIDAAVKRFAEEQS